MRKHSVGAAPHSGSWTPRFKVTRERKPAEDRLGRRNTSIMSYFPTVKGKPRMEGLRHYFHKSMALLLDARTDVVGWTADTSALAFEAGGRNLEFTPDLYVEEVNRTYAVRLLRPGTKRSDARAERHGAADAKYRERDMSLVVISGDEVESDPRLPNAKALFLNRVRDWPGELPAAVAARWGGACPTTLGAVHASLGGGRAEWLQLLSLAAYGYLHIDLGHELGAAMPVTACRPAGYSR